MKIAIGKDVQNLCRKCQSFLTAKFSNGEELRYCGAWRKAITAEAIQCDMFTPMGVIGDALDKYLIQEALEGQNKALEIDPNREQHITGFIKSVPVYIDPDTESNVP